MNIEEARLTLRRVFVLYDGERAWLQHDREIAQKWADDGFLAIEYGFMGRIKGKNDVTLPIKKED